MEYQVQSGIWLTESGLFAVVRELRKARFLADTDKWSGEILQTHEPMLWGSDGKPWVAGGGAFPGYNLTFPTNTLIMHAGAEMPVPERVRVRVVFGDMNRNAASTGFAGAWDRRLWGHTFSDSSLHIIAFTVLDPTKEELAGTAENPFDTSGPPHPWTGDRFLRKLARNLSIPEREHVIMEWFRDNGYHVATIPPHSPPMQEDLG